MGGLGCNCPIVKRHVLFLEFETMIVNNRSTVSIQLFMAEAVSINSAKFALGLEPFPSNILLRIHDQKARGRYQ